MFPFTHVAAKHQEMNPHPAHRWSVRATNPLHSSDTNPLHSSLGVVAGDESAAGEWRPSRLADPASSSGTSGRMPSGPAMPAPTPAFFATDQISLRVFSPRWGWVGCIQGLGWPRRSRIARDARSLALSTPRSSSRLVDHSTLHPAPERWLTVQAISFSALQHRYRCSLWFTAPVASHQAPQTVQLCSSMATHAPSCSMRPKNASSVTHDPSARACPPASAASEARRVL